MSQWLEKDFRKLFSRDPGPKPSIFLRMSSSLAKKTKRSHVGSRLHKTEAGSRMGRERTIQTHTPAGQRGAEHLLLLEGNRGPLGPFPCPSPVHLTAERKTGLSYHYPKSTPPYSLENARRRKSILMKTRDFRHPMPEDTRAWRRTSRDGPRRTSSWPSSVSHPPRS